MNKETAEKQVAFYQFLKKNIVVDGALKKYEIADIDSHGIEAKSYTVFITLLAKNNTYGDIKVPLEEFKQRYTVLNVIKLSISRNEDEHLQMELSHPDDYQIHTVKFYTTSGANFDHPRYKLALPMPIEDYKTSVFIMPNNEARLLVSNDQIYASLIHKYIKFETNPVIVSSIGESTLDL